MGQTNRCEVIIMAAKITGVQELVDYYDKLIDTKPTKKSLRQAAKIVKTEEKKQAKEIHDTYSKDVGNKYVKQLPVKMYKTKGYVHIGLKSTGGGSDWDKWKGLYFNHYGFYHNAYKSSKTRKNRIRGNTEACKYIAGSRWMDTAFEKSVDRAYDKMQKVLREELKKV